MKSLILENKGKASIVAGTAAAWFLAPTLPIAIGAYVGFSALTNAVLSFVKYNEFKKERPFIDIFTEGLTIKVRKTPSDEQLKNVVNADDQLQPPAPEKKVPHFRNLFKLALASAAALGIVYLFKLKPSLVRDFFGLTTKRFNLFTRGNATLLNEREAVINVANTTVDVSLPSGTQFNTVVAADNVMRNAHDAANTAVLTTGQPVVSNGR
ncbi:MAG: hypothetical protein J0H68_02950 [Sphingobacteriia bacterium]|nr:hypothetical protein [Sphingobacteriia bacterium]